MKSPRTDYSVQAERELGLSWHTAGPEGRERIVDRTWALVCAAKQAGTFRDPNARTLRIRKPVCKRGHPRTLETVGHAGHCRECENATARARHHARRKAS